MRGNTITLHMVYGRVAQAGNLWQYDYGQRLLIAGVDLPAAYEVHFSNAENGQSKTMIGDDTGVDIPDEYLLSGEKIHVWVYLHSGEADGETEYHGIINVAKRARPTNEEPTPEQQSVIDQTIAALNAAVDEAESIAEAIPETVNTALDEAKESGEFDGFSPIATVTKSGNKSTITITDKSGTTSAIVEDGKQGDPGQPGDDGVSPIITVTDITGGHRISITDADGTKTVDVMDGAKGDPGDPADLIDDNIQPSDPKYNKKTFSAQKIDGTVSHLNNEIDAKQDAPSTAGTSGQVLALDSNLAPVWTTPQSGGVSDVQVNGTSVVNQGVANVPLASADEFGAVKFGVGFTKNASNQMLLANPIAGDMKTGTNYTKAIVPSVQHVSTFYGLAKVAGADMASLSSVTVGQYPEAQRSAISQMLDAPETVSGTTPSITAKPGVRYICGEVSTLTIVAPASGCIDVTFTSGSAATVLTVSSAKTGVTAIKWANGFDPTSLDANTTYEVNILDGEFGVVGSWT